MFYCTYPCSLSPKSFINKNTNSVYFQYLQAYFGSALYGKLERVVCCHSVLSTAAAEIPKNICGKHE